ncbi:MAG TPA: hypothetical protein VIQ51_02845 [Chryseosolibacter sp.]
MNILRKMIIFLAGSLLPILLLSFGILFSVFQVLGSPSQIQNALGKSGVYDDAVASVIEENATQAGATSLQGSDAEAAVQAAVADSVSSDFVKDQTGEVLKDISSWLNGDTKELNFSVNLNPVKDDLVDNLTKQAKERAASLPTCTSREQLASLTTIDAFSLTCLPPGVSADTAAEQTRQQIVNSSVFQEASVDPNTLVGDGGQPIEEQLRPFKSAYQTAKQVMYISGVASIVGIALIVWLSKPKWVGIKRVGYILITTGIVGVITALITKVGVGAFVRSFLEKGSGVSTNNAVDAGKAILASICDMWLWMGVAALAIGISCLVGVRIWNKKHQSPKIDDDEHKKDVSSPPMNTPSSPIAP